VLARPRGARRTTQEMTGHCRSGFFVKSGILINDEMERLRGSFPNDAARETPKRVTGHCWSLSWSFFYGVWQLIMMKLACQDGVRRWSSPWCLRLRRECVRVPRCDASMFRDALSLQEKDLALKIGEARAWELNVFISPGR